MKRISGQKYVLLGVSAAILTASFTMPSRASNENQFFGTLTGATIGGIIGNQFGHGDGRIATTAAGAFAGGWIGNDIGYSMDNSRGVTSTPSSGGGYSSSSSASSYSYPTGYKPNYVAPNDTPSPESVYDQDYGQYCRTYSQQVNIRNHVQEHYGTACLQPDGTWRAVE